MSRTRLLPGRLAGAHGAERRIRGWARKRQRRRRWPRERIGRRWRTGPGRGDDDREQPLGADDLRQPRGDHQLRHPQLPDDARTDGPDGRAFDWLPDQPAGVVDGSEVLVYGATGAIGPSAVQIIKSLGGHVTAVCSSEHVELVAGLGADRVVDRTTTDFTADDRRYDVVLDPVGECSFRQCRKLLKPQGIWTSTDLGPLSQNLLLVLATRLSRGRRVLFPFPTIDQAMVEDLERLVEARQFAPVIDRTYPLEEIVEAYRYVEASGPSGHFWLGASD